MSIEKEQKEEQKEQKEQKENEYLANIRFQIRSDIKRVYEEEYQNVLRDFFKSEKVDFSKNDIINKENEKKPDKSIIELLEEENKEKN